MHDTDDIICWGCENPLDEDELESPYERDGHIWCDDCYHEEFEFTCYWCDEYGDNEDQHRYVVIFDAGACELALPGLYRVNRLPYYSQPMIGQGCILSRAVTWLGYLPPHIGDESWYPAGHLCAYCQRRALAHIAHATDCGIVAGM
jgi:hypothetical protein